MAVEVAVGLVEDEKGRILVQQRDSGRYLAGLWEFPGGKMAAGEAPADALRRELREELGIEVDAATPWMQIPHDYGDRRVLLRVFRVGTWRGSAEGCEGQLLAWRAPDALDPDLFPAANRGILNALRLSERYLITPSPRNRSEVSHIVARVTSSLDAGTAGMVQVRAPQLDYAAYRAFVLGVVEGVAARPISVLANAPLPWLRGLPAAGLHLPERRWRRLAKRPPFSGWIGASVHGPEGLRQVAALGLDFAVLGPVRATATHPATEPLGWQRFAQWVQESPLPVYALGGMDVDALPLARQSGAQGIAAIRGLLHDS